MTVKPIVDRDGGMARFAPMGSSNNVEVKMYEASDADAPRVYLHLVKPPSFDNPSGYEIPAKLDMAALRTLRDQCDWFLANHYLVRG